MSKLPPTLGLRHVAAEYVERGQTLLALDDISFEIAEGEFVVLIGPSGSGKSTMLDIISGLFAETAGTVTLSGVDSPFALRP